jgi:hypothetical protein
MHLVARVVVVATMKQRWEGKDAAGMAAMPPLASLRAELVELGWAEDFPLSAGTMSEFGRHPCVEQGKWLEEKGGEENLFGVKC